MKSINLDALSMLNVKTSRGDKFINPLEILYIKANNKHSFIYLTDLICIDSHHLIKWYEEKLPVPDFFRCHNSFIVNCFYINYTCGNSIILNRNNILIPLSRYKKDFYMKNLELFIRNKVPVH
jgi:DNA-binding LytR/AlgR family response regulator